MHSPQQGCRLRQHTDFTVFRYRRSSGLLGCMHYNSVSRFWGIYIDFRHGCVCSHVQKQQVIVFLFQRHWHVYYFHPFYVCSKMWWYFVMILMINFLIIGIAVIFGYGWGPFVYLFEKHLCFLVTCSISNESIAHVSPFAWILPSFCPLVLFFMKAF